MTTESRTEPAHACDWRVDGRRPGWTDSRAHRAVPCAARQGGRPGTGLRPREHRRPGREGGQQGAPPTGRSRPSPHYQSRFAAQDTYGLLMVLQALDAGGKDSTIRHVMSGVNPQGVVVHGFRAPSAEELDHDYLWRYAQRLPARGQIAIFNRSHYEDVLVVRVHPEFLKARSSRRARAAATSGSAATARSTTGSAILVENGFPVVKVFLNLSKEEQRRRFLQADRLPREELEVQRARRRGARALGRVPDGVLADAQRDEHGARAVVRGSRRPQVVPAGGRRGGAPEHARRDRSAVPDHQRRGA